MNEIVERLAQIIHDGRRTYKSSDEVARSVIAAMREPTEAMVDAADDTDALCWSLEPGEGLDAVIWSVAWKAMIDEALK